MSWIECSENEIYWSGFAIRAILACFSASELPNVEIILKERERE
jgi:hypothetical protein